MKIEVTLQTELVVEFDENSQDFKEMYENYKKYISNSDYEEFAENICSQIARYGIKDHIEGVGHVRENGEAQKDYFAEEGVTEIDNPVKVIGDFDINGMCDFEVFYTRILEE